MKKTTAIAKQTSTKQSNQKFGIKRGGTSISINETIQATSFKINEIDQTAVIAIQQDKNHFLVIWSLGKLCKMLDSSQWPLET